MEAAFGDRPDTASWLSWARVYARKLDPLSNPPNIPEDPEFTPEALQKFLPARWSALGPENTHSPSWRAKVT
jgi:hypothetical protein